MDIKEDQDFVTTKQKDSLHLITCQVITISDTTTTKVLVLGPRTWYLNKHKGLPWQLSWQRIYLKYRRPQSDSWVGKIWKRGRLHIPVLLGFAGCSDKESACNVGNLGLIPGLGRSPGGGHGDPLQYSCLEYPHGQWSLAG